MGVDYTTFLGPFLECKTTPNKMASRTIPWCENCKQETPTAFCPLCGFATIGKSVPYQRREPSFDRGLAALNNIPWDDEFETGGKDIYDANDERLIADHFHCDWSGDQVHFFRFFNDAGAKHFGEEFESRSGWEVREIEPKTINSQLRAVRVEHRAAIARMEKLYGKENVRLRWGLVSWAN